MSNEGEDTGADGSTERRGPCGGSWQGTPRSTADTERGSINVWQRWQGGTDVPFHRYCDFYPGREEPEEVPSDRHGVWIYFTRGIPRQALRYTPAIIFAAVILVGSAELAAGRPVSGQYLQGTGIGGHLVEVVLGVGWLVLLLWLLSKVELLPWPDLLQAILVYATLVILMGDVVYLFARATIALQEGTIDQLGDGSVLPGSGYLLIMFIGGHLVYDGMLRAENMFSRLHEKNPPIIGPGNPDSFDTDDEKAAAFERARDAYESNFLAEFRASLDHRIELGGGERLPTDATVSIRTAYLFSIVFVVPFFVLRLPDIVLAVVLSLLGLVEMLVFFQFLVLIKYFNRLLTRHSPYEDDGNDGFTLQYQPDHPDGYAGFRDLGKFATRVNALLFFGGLYTAYWLYTSGLPNLPAGGIGDPSGEFLVWSFHYLGPLLVYLLTVVVWIYFSFWQIHKAMRKGRERWIEMEIFDAQDGELPDEKRDLRQAPIWPLNVRMFVSIVIGDMLPLLSLVPLI